jgi:excisionase family DNA binding protein
MRTTNCSDQLELDGLLHKTASPGKYRLGPERANLIRTDPPVVLTVMEAAAYIACSPRKLRDLIHARRVKSARIGAKIVIRREWLDAYLENESRGGVAGLTRIPRSFHCQPMA